MVFLTLMVFLSILITSCTNFSNQNNHNIDSAGYIDSLLAYGYLDKIIADNDTFTISINLSNPFIKAIKRFSFN